MEPISADYMALRNAELSNQVQTAVMKKTMDAALEQSEQLLATLPFPSWRSDGAIIRRCNSRERIATQIQG